MGGAEEVNNGAEKSGKTEQLLGSVDMTGVQEVGSPDVKILSLSIVTPDRPDIVLPIPADGNLKGQGPWFTLKGGGLLKLKFAFQVSNKIVSGLKYNHTVWRSGLKVDSSKESFGTFSPREEPYYHELPEATVPSGLLARGAYTARYKFMDDDNKCIMELNYAFDIRKEWGPST